MYVKKYRGLNLYAVPLIADTALRDQKKRYSQVEIPHVTGSRSARI